MTRARSIRILLFLNAVALAFVFSACDSKLWKRIPLLGKRASSELEEKAAASRARSEILKEMIEVVEVQRPEDRESFGAWMNVLNQGADFEGIYNTLTHSERYRALERQTQNTGVLAYDAFVKEVAFLRDALRAASPQGRKGERLGELFPSDARPLPDQAERDRQFHPREDRPSVQDLRREQPSVHGSRHDQREAEALKDLGIFRASSIFTLKRAIGTLALENLELRRADREALAEWYASLVLRLSVYGVDFGLKQRNDPDPAFHRAWARRAPFDRIEWEVLNRYHRVFNAPFVAKFRKSKP